LIEDKENCTKKVSNEAQSIPTHDKDSKTIETAEPVTQTNSSTTVNALKQTDVSEPNNGKDSFSPSNFDTTITDRKITNIDDYQQSNYSIRTRRSQKHTVISSKQTKLCFDMVGWAIHL